MKTYAILYYDFIGNVALLTVPAQSTTDAKNYALENFSNLISGEGNFIKAVAV